MWRKKEEVQLNSDISSNNQAKEQIEARLEYLYFLQDHLPMNFNIRSWILEFNRLLSDRQGNTYHDRINKIREFDNEFCKFGILTQQEKDNIKNLPRVISTHTREEILEKLKKEEDRLFDKYGEKLVGGGLGLTGETNSIASKRHTALFELICKLVERNNGKYLNDFTSDELYEELTKLKSERSSTGKRLGKITRNSKNSFLLSSQGTSNLDEAIKLVGYTKKGIIERFIESVTDAVKAITRHKR